ncbi:hypothetical protein BDQ12DRAFT_681691 [Crucibulum laeve]|uniref:Uncharacterized protein n=1 Tax=Crucibulum laeve TaxID=68775 RepID=A0A5C3M2K2_9AGAR|nr:hypothetical protein BDQ12DRAFT_681691 [Crucibulum laeve]
MKFPARDSIFTSSFKSSPDTPSIQPPILTSSSGLLSISLLLFAHIFPAVVKTAGFFHITAVNAGLMRADVSRNFRAPLRSNIFSSRHFFQT